MKQLRIKDNSNIKKEDFFEIPGLVKAVSDKTLEQLEKEGVFVFPELVKEAEDITRDQMILQSVNDSHRSGNIMGFLGYGKERLVIESRFSRGAEDFLFQYLLEKVLDFPNVVNLETNAIHDDRMFSLLLFLFPAYLAAATRKGLFKAYVRKEYNDGNVKGMIDIQRHIKRNIPFVGTVAYNQREYAYDNYLMELVRHTIEFIKRKSYGYKLLFKVKDEVRLVVGATPGFEAKNLRNVMEKNKKNIVRHAFYYEYRALQRLCLLILRNEKTQVGLGTRKIYGILFDGAWLWEEYINLLVKDFFYHPKNKAGEGQQWLFSSDSRKIGKIYPDFIGKNTGDRVIADAKYKPSDNVGNADYLQLLAYMYRFDAKRALYFYPESGELTDKKMWLNRGSSYENNVKVREDIYLIKHGLRIPFAVGSYEEFVCQMKENEKVFVNLVKYRIEKR